MQAPAESGDAFPAIVCLGEGEDEGVFNPTPRPGPDVRGDFEGDDDVVAQYEPGGQYFLGCVRCGAELDRSKPNGRTGSPSNCPGTIGLSAFRSSVSGH